MYHRFRVCQLCAVACLVLVGLAIGLCGSKASHAAAPAKTTTSEPVASYVGTETCVQCHEEVGTALNKHWHGRAMAGLEKKGQGHLCEGCHGPGSQHVNDPSALTAAPLRKFARAGNGCLTCHNTSVSSIKWRMSEHAHAGTSCIICHGQAHPAPPPAQGAPSVTALARRGQQIDPHGEITRQPATELCLSCHGEKRAELAMPSHHPILEKRITCADCHNPHVRMNDKLKHEVCITCHVKQRGPFRFEHGAISGHLGDACLDCHRPHGSPNQRLLKLSNRGLCLQCHANKVTHFAGRTCWDCHTGIHGSNSNALLFTE